MTKQEDEVLAVVTASQPRRWLGISMLVVLGVLLIRTAFAASGAVFWQAGFLIFGLAAFYGADRMRRATEARIELTREVLRSSTGEVLARVANVSGVERGAFAFKPSNGFLVRLHTAEAPGAWRPGLWWRRGTFVGVGGVVPGGQSRAMAEVLTALILDIMPDREPG